MVVIGIVSDTHITNSNYSDIGVKLLRQIKETFKDVNEIIHAGDISSKIFLNDLNDITPVMCVNGHEDLMDFDRFITLKRGVYTIGVIHEQPKDLEKFCRENCLHILIFGHTHQPLIKGTNFNTLLINPGSPTYPKAPPYKPGFKIPVPKSTVVTLIIDEDNILSTYLINLKS
jgi:putative phosphoesterase